MPDFIIVDNHNKHNSVECRTSLQTTQCGQFGKLVQITTYMYHCMIVLVPHYPQSTFQIPPYTPTRFYYNIPIILSKAKSYNRLIVILTATNVMSKFKLYIPKTECVVMHQSSLCIACNHPAIVTGTGGRGCSVLS